MPYGNPGIPGCCEWADIMNHIAGFTPDLVPVPLTIIGWNSEFNENQNQCSFMNTDMITTKFCTYQDSTAVLVYAKYCCD